MGKDATRSSTMTLDSSPLTSIGIPLETKTWEVVAACLLAQQNGLVLSSVVTGDLHENIEIAELCGVASVSGAVVRSEALPFDSTYRAVETEDSYIQTLATKAGGLKWRERLRLSQETGVGGGIILCPFAIKQDFALPIPMWLHIAHFLRSYRVPFKVMGDYEERIEAFAIPEQHVLSAIAVKEKVRELAYADLIVGVPNAWTWLATAWNKKMLLPFPDGTPQDRWLLPYDPDSVARLLYGRDGMHVPLILAGVRKLLGKVFE